MKSLKKNYCINYEEGILLTSQKDNELKHERKHSIFTQIWNCVKCSLYHHRLLLMTQSNYLL